jgi:hypothetical protein
MAKRYYDLAAQADSAAKAPVAMARVLLQLQLATQYLFGCDLFDMLATARRFVVGASSGIDSASSADADIEDESTSTGSDGSGSDSEIDSDSIEI